MVARQSSNVLSASSIARSFTTTLSPAPQLFDTVVDHDVAKRTGSRHDISARCDCLFRALDVDPLTCVLFHPHPPSTGAATERVGAVPHHLDGRPDGFENVPGCNEHVIVPAEVARVVVGDLLAVRFGLDEAFLHEMHQELTVMDHFVFPTELRVFVTQRVEAVRALSDDLRYTEFVERRDVLQRESLKNELVAGAARRVARAELLGAEDGEIDAAS